MLLHATIILVNIYVTNNVKLHKGASQIYTPSMKVPYIEFCFLMQVEDIDHIKFSNT